MKTKLIYILSLLLILGCKKEEFNPNIDSRNQNLLSVEGLLSDSPEMQHIKLTRTSAYFATSAPVGVENANVTVTCDNETITYTHTTNGVYVPPAGFAGVVGKTYHLLVVDNGTTYTAQSIMKEPLVLDSLASMRDEYETDKFQIRAWFTDNGTPDEYFIIKYARNGIMHDTLTRWTEYGDLLTNGMYLEDVPLLYMLEGNENDVLTVYTFSASLEYYDFLRIARRNLEEPIPFFPPSGGTITGNISGNAVGFFQASAVRWKDVILKR